MTIFSASSLKKISLSLAVVFLCSCFFCTGCRNTNTPLSATGFYFDTVVTVTLYENGSEEILNQCMELAAYYDALFSPTVEGSDIFKLNRSNGSYIEISPETTELLQTSLAYSVLSDGLVDPTIGALSGLWNFGSENQSLVPSKEEITRALSHVDYRGITIDNTRAALKDPLSAIDLGFIAKGYIGDRMRDFLLAKGVTSAIVNLGGNLVVIGQKPDNTPFKIGIQTPFAKSGTAAIVLELSDISVVSAGNYERCFEKDGVLYHHILSTKTGYPVNSGLSQVTILSESSVEADALSTLCFILGYEKAASLLKNMPEVQAIFITEDGENLYVNFP